MMQQLSTRKRRGDRGAKIFYITMMALPILQFIIFYIIVNFNSILLAFQQYNNGYEWRKGNIFGNFKEIFYELRPSVTMVYWTKIKNSLIYCALSLLVVMPLTMLFAYYIYKKMPGGGFFKLMLFGPSMITSVVWVLIFKYFIDYGVVSAVRIWGHTELNYLINKDRILWTIVFYLLFSFGSSILLYLHAMSQIPSSLLEAAQIDGASEFRSFFSVVIPSIWPTIVSFLIINLSQVAVNQANLHALFTVVKDRESTIGYHLFYLVADPAHGPTYPIAATWGLILTFIVAPLTAFVRWAANKFGPSAD